MSELTANNAAPAVTSTPSESSSPSLETNEGASAPAIANLEAQAANGTPAQKAEAKKTLKQLKIKFNGKDLNEDLPFEIPDTDEARNYMTNKLQMSRLAQNKSQQYSQLEGEVKNFVEMLKKDPRKILSDPNIGVDVKQFAAQILQEEIENSQKSPEQLKQEALEKEIKSLKEEREKEKEDNRQRELTRLEAQEYERYDMLMTKALETHKDLPRSPYVIKKMADYMLLGVEKGMDISPEDVIPLVREEIKNDLKEMFAVMPEDVIEQLVGKETITRLRKKGVQKAKAGPAPIQTSKSIFDTGQKNEQKSDKPSKKMSYKDFFKA